MPLSWNDIPQRIADGNYGIDVGWGQLLHLIEHYETEYNLVLCPDYQRGHVWTDAQRTAYLEAKLSGGVPFDCIRFNQPGWMGTFHGAFECVDGLQRLTTALLFLRNQFPAYGQLCSEFGGRAPSRLSFHLKVNCLPNRKEVLRWYLELNAGGTPHTASEIDRVRALLAAESAS
jgi:Protein of unknown function DUF262